MKRQIKMENEVPTIHTSTKIKGLDACKFILNKQTELKLSGAANGKNLGIVINIIVNDYVALLNKSK